MMHNFEVISEKFNTVRICPCGNYAHKWTTKIHDH